MLESPSWHPNALPRYKALYEALLSDKIEIRVLPDTAFGLIHGKAGVIRYANGSSTAFLGSVNESASAWKLNYELLWESDEPGTIDWVQEEFDALWNDHRARALADCPFIQNDVQRIIQRQVVEPEQLQTSSVHDAAAAAAVETPIYRREQGLWPIRSTSPAWPWNAIASAGPVWCWPIKLAWAKPSSLRWLRC